MRPASVHSETGRPAVVAGSTNRDATDAALEQLEAWPPATVNCALIADRRVTALLLDRVSLGAAARARHDGLVVELGVSLSGSAAGVAAACESLTQLGPSNGEPTYATWVRLGDPVAANIRSELLPGPHRAGLVIETALRVIGNLSAVPDLLGALGVDIPTHQALDPWLLALEGEHVRLHRSRPLHSFSRFGAVNVLGPNGSR